MASTTIRSIGSDEELTDRFERLDSTIRSLLATAALPLECDQPISLARSHMRESLGAGALEQLAALVDEADRAQRTVAEHLLAQPMLAARRVTTALDRIQVASDLGELFRMVPGELCWAGDFDRVLFSRVEGSTWLPTSWHTVDPDCEASIAFAECMRDARIAMANGMIEAEVVRRRVPARVSDAVRETRTYASLVDVGRVESYLVAPVVSGDAVVGLLHADTFVSARALTDADLATIRAYADGVGLVLERLALVERLNDQRARIARALAEAEQAVDALCTAPVRVTLEAQTAEPVDRRTADVAPADGLTLREREVLQLVVSGATNGQIADKLTVSETTVKSHVKHILRKLRASNRSEAIALYLARSAHEGQP